MGGFPPCRQCHDGELIPLSDFGTQGAAIHYKAWVCTNPKCGFNLKVRGGEVWRNEPIFDAREAALAHAANSIGNIEFGVRRR
ncbi:MAG: hypothetical protein HY329_21670 [Chloroflexi bacterium]|nr:hypothetical protein [Chloroflexota bacterium]